MIEDSGGRTCFKSGAVRDCQMGKGRCDLLPLDVVADGINSNVLGGIDYFQSSGSVTGLYGALNAFLKEDGCSFKNYPDMILEVSKHFEEGAQKYGERNWEKGIPEERYIDSAVRHYLKYKKGETDERHDRAFAWNIICLIWTHTHITEKSEA